MRVSAQLPMESLLESLQQRVEHTAELAALELRLASLSGLAMLQVFVIATVAVVISWGLVVITLIVLLSSGSYPWPAIALSFAAVHALLAVLSWKLIVRLSRNLTLPALRGVVSDQN